MKLTGWIIYNGNLQGNKFLDFAEMLHAAAQSRNHDAIIYKNNDLLTYLGSAHLGLLPHSKAGLPDYVVFTDKDIYLAKQLELLGIPVFNNARAIEISDDKIATYQLLAQHKLPIPKTIIAPKVFIKNETTIFEHQDLIIETLGFPLIIKEAFGSFGEQVYLINNSAELQGKMNELHGKAYMFQQFIASSYGTDLRLQVVGNQVVAAMKRTAKDDFRANVTAGGSMEAYKPTALEEEIAIAGTKAIGADFAGVDLLFGENNTPIICEINSNAHIRNMYDCTGINAAESIIDYITDKFENK